MNRSLHSTTYIKTRDQSNEMFQRIVDMPRPENTSNATLPRLNQCREIRTFRLKVSGTVVDGRGVYIAQRGILPKEKKKDRKSSLI